MIVFDNMIYVKDAIIQACLDYKDLANIITEEKNGMTICMIKNPKGDLNLICNEFGNHVLNLTVMMGGQ